MWDDLIENLWRHVVAVGVVLVAVVVGFSRLVYSTFQGVKKTNFGSELHASPHIHIRIRHSIYGYIWIRQYGSVPYMWYLG